MNRFLSLGLSIRKYKDRNWPWVSDTFEITLFSKSLLISWRQTSSSFLEKFGFVKLLLPAGLMSNGILYPEMASRTIWFVVIFDHSFLKNLRRPAILTFSDDGEEDSIFVCVSVTCRPLSTCWVRQFSWQGLCSLRASCWSWLLCNLDVEVVFLVPENYVKVFLQIFQLQVSLWLGLKTFHQIIFYQLDTNLRHSWQLN